MPVSIPGFSSCSSFYSLFTPLKHSQHDDIFATGNYSYIDLNRNLLQGEENSDQPTSFTEDCLRCIKQLLSQYGQLKQNELFFNILLKFFPKQPVEFLNVARSLYLAAVRRENIDLAILNILGLTSSCLLADGNNLSRLAQFIRETIVAYIGEGASGELFFNEENAFFSYFCTALAVLAVTGRYYWNDRELPQRTAFQVPAFLGHLLIRANCYWNQLGHIAQHAAESCHLPVQDEPGYLCIKDKIAESHQQRIFGREAWSCSEQSSEGLINLRPETTCHFSYTPQELKLLKTQGILYSQQPQPAPEEESGEIIIEGPEEILPAEEPLFTSSGEPVSIEMSPLLFPLTIAALQTQPAITGNRVGKIAAVAGATALFSAGTIASYYLLRSEDAEPEESFSGELTDQERAELEQQWQEELLEPFLDEPLEPYNPGALADLESDIFALESLLVSDNPREIKNSFTPLRYPARRIKRETENAAINCDTPGATSFSERDKYWESRLNATMPDDPASKPLTLLKNREGVDAALLAARESFGSFPLLDGSYTRMDQIDYAAFTTPFNWHLMNVACEISRSEQVNPPAGNKINTDTWLHLGRYYDRWYTKLNTLWGQSLVRADVEVAQAYQKAIGQVEAIIQSLENDFGSAQVHQGFDISAVRYIAKNFQTQTEELKAYKAKQKQRITALQEQSAAKSITIHASLSPQEIYAEQGKLLKGLLKKNKLKTDPLINNVISYLTGVSDSKKIQRRTAEVSRLLLQPLGEYGAGKKDVIPHARREAVIAEWLNHALFGAPAEEWLIKQLIDSKQNTNSLYVHENFKRAVENKIKDANLSPAAQTYYQATALKRIAPTLALQLTQAERSELDKQDISHPQWGYLHAGSLLLTESGVDISSLKAEEIEEVGVMVDTYLREQALPPEYARYFQLPALIYSAYTTKEELDISSLDHAQMESIYDNYFKYTAEWAEKNDPFTQLNKLTSEWKTRRELARDILTANGLDHGLLDALLSSESNEPKINLTWRMDDLTDDSPDLWVPNVNPIFAKQNQKLSETSRTVDTILLANVFDQLSESDQAFLQKAKIERVKASFDITEGVNFADIKKRYPEEAGKVAEAIVDITQEKTITIDNAVDLLRCSCANEERIYALRTSTDTHTYQLSRVDSNEEKIVELLDNKNKILALKLCSKRLKIEFDKALKVKEESTEQFISHLADHHETNVFDELIQRGYGKDTKKERLRDFLLDLIPFYSCVTEAQKGNAHEAGNACAFDLIAIMPVIGQTLKLGNQYNRIVGKTLAAVLRQNVQRMGFKNVFKLAGQQFSHAFPLIRKEARHLGVQILHVMDPGFELLTWSGVKGVRAMHALIGKMEQKGSGLTRLAAKLEGHAVKKVKLPKVSQMYYAGNGPGFGRVLDVVPAGRVNGRQLWVQLNPDTGIPFGRNFIADMAGYLQPAPITLRKRFYLLKKEGISGRGGPLAAKSWHALASAFAPPGMDLLYKQAFLRVAKHFNVVIGLRAPNPLSASLLKEGYPSKNFHVKAKSSTTGPTAGFIPVEPRYSKVALANYAKQIVAVEKAHAAGAEFVDLVITRGRINELIAAGHLKSLGHDRYSAFYPQGEAIFYIYADGKVLNAEKKPVQVLTNPPETGEFTKNLKPITADYDLFTIIPHVNQNYNKKYLEVSPVLMHGKFELSFLQPRKTDAKEKAEKLLQVKWPGDIDPDKGNLDFFCETIARRLNQEIAVEGYKGGKLVWHGDEVSNPFSDGFDVNDKPIFFLPDGEVIQIQSIEELKTFYNRLREQSFAPEYSPAFAFPSYSGITDFLPGVNAVNKMIYSKLAIKDLKIIKSSTADFPWYTSRLDGREITTIHIDNKFFPIRMNENRKFYEVYDLKNSQKTGYPVMLNKDNKWCFGFSTHIDAKSYYMNDALAKKITAEFYDTSVDSMSLSIPNSHGIVENNAGATWLFVGGNYIRINKAPSKLEKYTFQGGAFTYDKKKMKFRLIQ